MSQSTLISPVENMTGKLSSTSDGRVTVTRRKCYGKDAKGRPVYGPLILICYLEFQLPNFATSFLFDSLTLN